MVRGGGDPATARRGCQSGPQLSPERPAQPRAFSSAFSCSASLQERNTFMTLPWWSTKLNSLQNLSDEEKGQAKALIIRSNLADQALANVFDGPSDVVAHAIRALLGEVPFCFCCTCLSLSCILPLCLALPTLTCALRCINCDCLPHGACSS